MISYGRQHIDNNDIKAVVKVLKNNLITQGPSVEKFEKSLSKPLDLNIVVHYLAEQQLYTY